MMKHDEAYFLGGTKHFGISSRLARDGQQTILAWRWIKLSRELQWKRRQEYRMISRQKRLVEENTSYLH